MILQMNLIVVLRSQMEEETDVETGFDCGYVGVLM